MSFSPETIRLEFRGQVGYLTLNRPETRNAFDEKMIAEIAEAVSVTDHNATTRALVITGEGSAFSAGANVEWMRRMGEAGFEANLKDATAAALMLDALSECRQPTIARVNGPATGGGVGLVAACDIAVGIESSHFSFPEVRIGLAPAVIAPHVIRKLGQSLAGELFLTGRRMESAEALDKGLLNYAVTLEDLDDKVEELLSQVLSASPNALTAAKRLVRNVPKMSREAYIDYTARMIAELRTSEDGREGTSAFLEKRIPLWSMR